jgi:hypothetical protein
MTLRSMIRTITFLVAVGSGFGVSQARAAFVGSFGVNADSPSVSPGSSLAGATTFTVASMSSNGNTTDGFSGIGLLAGEPFSGGSFTLGSPTGFTFSNPTFGTFTETAAPVMISQGLVGNVVQSETFYILGSYVGGPVGSIATPASFTIGFTQNGGATNSVSASGTLTIPPSSVPEPGSMALLSIGLLVFGGYRLRQRFADQDSAV